MSDASGANTTATRTKICGITNTGDRDLAVAAGADALGFIVDVTVETPREISPEQAATLVEDVPPFVTTVLVTMPDSVGAARELSDSVEADIVQVHDGLDPDEVAELTGTETVVAVVDAATPDQVTAYDPAADALLVDSVDADGGGGTGRTHDWDATRRLRERLDSPVILAGGLTPANVAEAVGTVEPFAVDVATGVEHRGGEKDPDAVREFVDAVRSDPAVVSG